MVEAAIEVLRQRVSPELVVFFISMLPVLELRGGLIAASVLGIPWGRAAIICIIGNMLPVPLILLFFNKIIETLKKTKKFKKLAEKYEMKVIKGAEELRKNHPKGLLFAIYLYVAIPIPFTGTGTGSLIASFLGIPIKRSFFAIAAGVCTSAVVMLVLTYFFPMLFGFRE
ncbi:MAG: small multi-drug export protein [Oscillospiraceae bacterium]|nr:small multi-drug export protein [Oscillospiraceae bacterium]